MKKRFYLIPLFVLFSSCEKIVELDLKNDEPKLVIDGAITNGIGPFTVTITKTMPINQSTAYNPVTTANVVISDDAGNTDVLTQVSSGKYQTHTIEGIAGRTYTLKVISEGKTYDAVSKMSKKINLDGVKYNTSNNEVTPLYTDPIEFGNSYLFILFINGKKKKGFNVWNDNINNGILNVIPIGNIGVESNDIVEVEMQCITNSTYNYYFALNQFGSNIVSGVTTAQNPPSNILGGALGIFSAHTSDKKSIVIP